jgi:hypothetical protein
MSVKSFSDCLAVVKGMTPKTLSNNPEFLVLLKLLAYSISKSYDELDRVDNAYNVDFVDDRELPKLADTLGIEYPIGASANVLRLLLKYYGKIIKNRGTEDSIKQLIRILEFSEEAVYDISLEDYTNISIVQEDEYFIKIMYDGITDFDFAKSMLRKVIPAGYRFEVSNRNGSFTGVASVAKGFDRGRYTEAFINIECDTTFTEHVSVVESISITES